MDGALNSLLYARSFYLDAMAAGQWHALVLGDYQAVMPLPWRRKGGIRYLYQPVFTQQTGIFSAQPVTPELVDTFLHRLSTRFRFAEIFLNYGNAHPSLARRNNFILSLDASYEQLSGGYKKDLIRNLRATTPSKLQYVKDFDYQIALRNFRQEYASRLPAIKEEDYRHFAALCRLLQQRDQLLVRAVFDEAGQPLSTAVFLKDKARFYLIHSTTPPAGRAMQANHFLLDRFIREWAGSPTILDFEGSDQPGIAHFYENFGGVNQPYFFHRHNRLPWPLRLLK